MKKAIMILSILLIAGIIGVIFATMKFLNYHNRVELSGASHRIVVVVDPTSVTGGTKIIDETYSLSGSSSTIMVSVNVEVQ